MEPNRSSSGAGGGGSSSSAPGAPSLQDIFSLRRPKDVKAGVSSGVKSLGKGLVGGAVGLIAAPVVGATQAGLAGFAKGIATGARRAANARACQARHGTRWRVVQSLLASGASPPMCG